MTTELTTTEHQKYLKCNATIEHGLQTFFDVGTALMIVRSDRLYREEYGTFEDYCQEKWGWTRQHASRLIASAEVVANLSPIGDILEPIGSILPTTESQARELAKVEPKRQQAVWKNVVATAPKGKVTAKHVKEVVAKQKEPAKSEPAKAVVAAPTEPPKQPVGAPTRMPTFAEVWASLPAFHQKRLDSYPGVKHSAEAIVNATIALVQGG